jgi:hypothetical protein
MKRPEISWQDEKFWEEWMRHTLPAVEEMAQIEGENTMIDARRSTGKQASNSTRGVQFLSPRHVEIPLALKITEVTTSEPDNFGNPVVVYFVDSKGVQYSKGFSLTSDLLCDICDMLGKDESKWVGSILICSAVAGKRGGMQLHFAAPKKAK